MQLPKLNLRPINDKCVDCNKDMLIDDRQELAWDEDNNPRRRCEKCMNARKKVE